MTPIWSIALKDLRILFRDRSALAFIFGFPLIFTAIFGVVYGGGSRDKGSPIKILVCNQDSGKHGAELLDTMREMEMKVEVVGTQKSMDERIKKGSEALGLTLPKDYSEQLDRTILASVDGDKEPTQVRLSVVVDPPQQLVAEMAKGALNGAIGRANGKLFRAVQIARIPVEFRSMATKSANAGSGRSPVVLESHMAQMEKQPSTGDLMIPGYAVYFVFMMANGVAATLLEERQEGTLKRMLSSPITRNQILLGKMLARAFIGLIQVAMLFTIGKFALHLSITPADIPALAVVALVNIFAATGLGMLIATMGKTMEQIQGMTMMAMLAMGFLSGTLIPRQFLPEAVQKISFITPHAWALSAYQDLILRHKNLLMTVPNLGVLFIFGAVFYALALARFKFEA